MPSFSTSSVTKLNSCHYAMKFLFMTVVKSYDCSIIFGHRNQITQTKAFNEKRSKLEWPNSAHNKFPSWGVDAAPYPIIWDTDHRKNLVRYYHFAGYVKAVAHSLGILIRWGGDWDDDNDFMDQTFDDLVHFEFVGFIK